MALRMTSLSWQVQKQVDDLSGLVLVEDSKADRPLQDDEVLVEIRAASLNYRDLVIAKGKLGLVASQNVIPGSDGAGVVINTGTKVTAIAPGDRVVTHLVPSEFPAHPELYPLAETTLPHMGHICAGLGQELDGTLTTCGVFKESCLARLGPELSFEQAATLSCSGITAWNALMGLRGREVRKDDWVLIQGTGGVSIAAMQFALAAGAYVIATTSSAEKASKLKQLGAHHIINYREDSGWGSTAKRLTPGSLGVDIVVDVGGNATVTESLKAVKVDGLVVMAGLLGTSETPEPLMSVLSTVCTVRGILLGTRKMMVDMINFIGEHNIDLALDTKLFALTDVKAAFHRLEEQKHFAKVVIRV